MKQLIIVALFLSKTKKATRSLPFPEAWTFVAFLLQRHCHLRPYRAKPLMSWVFALKYNHEQLLLQYRFKFSYLSFYEKSSFFIHRSDGLLDQSKRKKMRDKIDYSGP